MRLWADTGAKRTGAISTALHSAKTARRPLAKRVRGMGVILIPTILTRNGAVQNPLRTLILWPKRTNLPLSTLHTTAPAHRFCQTSRWAFCAPRIKDAFMEAFGQFIPLILIFGIMYFLLIRPQQKKVKEHAAMVEAVRRGDQVITQGGLIGKVSKVKEDNEVEVELAEGVKVRVVKSTIAQVVSKTEPAK